MIQFNTSLLFSPLKLNTIWPPWRGEGKIYYYCFNIFLLLSFSEIKGYQPYQGKLYPILNSCDDVTLRSFCKGFTSDMKTMCMYNTKKQQCKGQQLDEWDAVILYNFLSLFFYYCTSKDNGAIKFPISQEN